MTTQDVLRPVLLAGLLTLLGCNDLAEPGEYLYGAGTGDSPEQAGPYGVGWKSAVHIDRFWLSDFDFDVYYPSLLNGDFDFSGSPYPVVVLLPNDGVWVTEYSTLAARLGSWGMVVAVPEAPWDLPGLGPLRPGAVLDRLSASMQEASFWKGGLDLTRAALGGVGAGGSVADAITMSDARFDAWFLLAGVPSVPPNHRAGPVLLLGGTPGCDGLPEALESVGDAYSPPYLWGRVPGLTAALLTDSALYAVASSADSTCTLDSDAPHTFRALSSILVPFLQHYVAGDDELDAWLSEPTADVTLHWNP